jgi:hypothetical protein
MKVWEGILCGAITLVASASSTAAQAADPLGLPPITLPAELDRVLREYEKAWRAGDGTALAQVFTDDGFALSNGSMPVRGREGIARTLSRPGGELQLRAFAWATADTVGYIVGGFQYPGSTGPGGKFLLALRKGGDGKWRIAADMDNSATPRR